MRPIMPFPFADTLRQTLRTSLAAFEHAQSDDTATTLKHAAVAITIVENAPGSGEAAFLLTRRAKTLRGHAGQWSLPGGRCDPGESAVEAALREVEEELGLVLAPEELELVAVHRTAAANEAGRPLIASVFRHPHLAQQSRPTITPAAEIEEVRWTDPTHPLPDDVAPLLRWLVEREEEKS